MKQKKIFIVDDDSSTLNILSLILQNAGYEVEVDSNGCMDFLLPGDLPDLILLDNCLGNKNGIIISRELKAAELTKQIPVIIISAMQNIDDIYRQAGADNYLSKPFSITQLLEIIETTLGERIHL